MVVVRAPLPMAANLTGVARRAPNGLDLIIGVDRLSLGLDGCFVGGPLTSANPDVDFISFCIEITEHIGYGSQRG